jgi:hypothetical protein
MKQVAVLALLALFSSVPVLAQAPAAKPAAPAPAAKPAVPAAEPVAPAASAVPAEKSAGQESVKLAAGKGGRSRANEDARECLQLATNTEIIKCAEKFL